MAACGEQDISSLSTDNLIPNTNTLHHIDNRRSSITEMHTTSSSPHRSPSLSSLFDNWPTLLVSKKPPSFYNKMKKKFARDPVIIERCNLVNISKLIVKELLETSLKHGRMLDSDHMPLQHFFIVLEHVLRHGLRPKKGLLGPKKELWDILQLVEKLAPEAQDITTSVRDLPTVRTHMGRARAWLRLALMQKKLADYLKVLVDHKDEVLVEFFEPDALMMSEEANIIEGLLTGLNVIDCNLCVKEEDLDCQQGVIDFSLYLRSSHHLSCGDSPENDLDPDDMTTVLDQKNYIEELNRHLNATVANLQANVESLTTTNALMKEDLAIANTNMLELREENTNLKAELNETPRPARPDITQINQHTDKEIEKLKEQLENEQRLRIEAERELHLQVSLKAEMEVAMKLLEKDIHEKQDTIISLRRQLDDIKIINLEMYKKLQECESSLKHKTELIAKLEGKSYAMTETLQKMEEKHLELARLRSAAEETLQRAGLESQMQEERRGELEGELKVEREWRNSMQNTIVTDRDKINTLQQDMAQLKMVAEKYVTLQEEHYRLSEQCREQELTLEELGSQLSNSKLQVSELREQASLSEAMWAADKAVRNCTSCQKEFNLTRRKHHCRHCGGIFCNSCSDNSTSLPSSAKPVRVCDECYVLLVARNSVIH